MHEIQKLNIFFFYIRSNHIQKLAYMCVSTFFSASIFQNILTRKQNKLTIQQPQRLNIKMNLTNQIKNLKNI